MIQKDIKRLRRAEQGELMYSKSQIARIVKRLRRADQRSDNLDRLSNLQRRHSDLKMEARLTRTSPICS